MLVKAKAGTDEFVTEKYHDQIQTIARRKYLTGEREPDGSVLIRTLELV